MSAKRQQKGTGNSRKRKGSHGGAGQIYSKNIPTDEPRICPCPLHESFWVTLPSKQVYALPECRVRAYRAAKREAFRQFIYAGLIRTGAAVEKALYVAQRVIEKFYTRTVLLVEALGWTYDSKKTEWVQA